MLSQLDITAQLLILVGGLSAFFFVLAFAASIADAISRKRGQK